MKYHIALLLLVFSSALYADVRLPQIFGDSMVLQRGRPIPVWGWANAGEKITVQLHRQQQATVAGADGKWRLDLAAEQAGGPFQLVVQGTNTITIHDVLIGEVWVCSGQSNMEFVVNGAINAAQEIAAAHYPLIRDINVPKAVSVKLESDLPAGGAWKPATPENVGQFTAVGYFFARELYNRLHVPVGLIHSSWGGTDVESWTSQQAMASSDLFGDLMKHYPTFNVDSIAGNHLKAMQKKVDSLQGGLPDSATTKTWKEKNLDDRAWQQMKVPGLWERQGLDGFDGVVWLRKEIEIPAQDAGKPARLMLAMIDDADETYVNGVRIGSTNGYNLKRSYAVPAGTFTEGKNTIAVRVDDTGGGGGIYGKDDEVKIVFGSDSQSLAGKWKYRVASMLQGAGSIDPNSYPGLLFNAMIQPLIPYAIKGVIWYQGENNAGRAYQYRTAFPMMITDWRKRWKEGNFPFYFVQLASFNAANGNANAGSSWAELREAQSQALALPNTGMAVTTDIGQSNDVHPKNKQEVGRRLAAVALRNVYRQTTSGGSPMYQALKVVASKATISFSNTGGGLMAKDSSGSVSGFEVAGADKHFYPGQCSIQGDQVAVVSDSVAHPVAVRYAWADDAGSANLFSKDGFPVAPFRTDTWEAMTVNQKYTIGH